ncbi:MAG TPA: xanthine dehydrogenase molybdopterin binding subunit [Verrucomicrobiae bacterium]|nr:xanthine dehydrogenase molybdopterin binding subunit [Verrucomicrobiae bacterium]
MADAFQFVLNGRPVRVEGTSPNTTLLEFLRARGLTGSKEGCAEGDCGACSVAVLERAAGGAPQWRAVNSCLMPVPCLAGSEVITVEGVAEHGLHPVQRCLVEQHGSQCGYCTPGIVMALFEAFHRADLTESWQLDDQLCGNLCRCTGYRPIRDAAGQALAQAANDGAARRAPCEVAPTAKPVEYHAAGESFFRPTSLDALFKLLKRHPGARLIAGGTELGLDLTKRFQKFSALIALDGIPDLTTLHEEGDSWRIGAAVPLTVLEDKLGGEYPALRSMLRLFGSRQVRNRATLGGNLATASPIGDAAPLLMALGARLVLRGRGHRQIPIDKLFTGYRQTCLKPGEIIVAVLLPHGTACPGLRQFSAFYKVSKRREMDIATVAGAFVVELDEQGRVGHARLAFGGVAATPIRAVRAERLLMYKEWNERTLTRVLKCLAEEFQPISDVRGSAEFRRALVASLFEKFFYDSRADSADSSGGHVGFPITPPLSPRERETGGADGLDVVGSRHAVHRRAILPLPSGEGRGEGKRGDQITAVAGEPPTSHPPPHESAHLHVTGEANYADDLTSGQGMLEVWPVCSPHAHARLMRRDATAARKLPGVHAVLLAEDVPGVNDTGVVRKDEPLLADQKVQFHGQIVALVVGDSMEACRRAAEHVVIEYEPLPAIFTIEQAIAAQSFHNEPNFIRRGDAANALASAPHRLEGELASGGQDHFYLETQAAWAKPGEGGTMRVVSSTQHPSEVQGVVADVLDVPAARVIVEVPRVGGGFGGKETQAAAPAALAALAAHKTGRAVRVRFNRDQDMTLTGKRHPFLAKFQAGFDAQGQLLAVKAELFSNAGWSLDLSQAVTDRALLHLDNAYFIPHVEFRGQVARTNLASNTAFRGFGGPQGMLVIEEILDRVARRLGLPPEVVRERNLYRGAGETNTTPYGQEIGDARLRTLWDELKRTSDFETRRAALAQWNAANPHRKRGLAITPVKFGISFTVTHLNQAGALVLIYQDGSVQVNHGGIEMGQGIHTNILAIAARELGLAPERIRVMPTSTASVPNTSATAASAGTDLNGAAVQCACATLLDRLRPIAAKLLAPALGNEPRAENLCFAEDAVFAVPNPQARVTFAQVVQRACAERVSLAATGYYRTPGIAWDRTAGSGRPFHYFANGAAVSEVEVDGFTGMMQVLRVDILQDCGDTINAGVNRGQIEGGFVQGMGWLTCEELKWDAEGRLLTHSPDTYKIPSFGDAPRDFRVNFLAGATQPNVIHGSKAVGEPPLMLALSVRGAIRDAIAAFGAAPGEIALASPATTEAIFMAIQRQRQRPAEAVPAQGARSAKSILGLKKETPCR